MLSYYRPRRELPRQSVRLATYITAREAAAAASGLAASAYTMKHEALEELVSDMKSNICYAKNTADFDDGKLWRQPVEGGKVSAYRIKRRHHCIMLLGTEGRIRLESRRTS